MKLQGRRVVGILFAHLNNILKRIIPVTHRGVMVEMAKAPILNGSAPFFWREVFERAWLGVWAATPAYRVSYCGGAVGKRRKAAGL